MNPNSDEPWIGVGPDMGALRRIVCETLFRISDSDCQCALFVLRGTRSVIARIARLLVAHVNRQHSRVQERQASENFRLRL